MNINTDKIAEIIKARIYHNTEYNSALQRVLLDEYTIFAQELADLYEKEDKKIQKESEELKRHPKRELEFDPKQFIKKAGCEE